MAVPARAGWINPASPQPRSRSQQKFVQESIYFPVAQIILLFQLLIEPPALKESFGLVKLFDFRYPRALSLKPHNLPLAASLFGLPWDNGESFFKNTVGFGLLAAVHISQAQV